MALDKLMEQLEGLITTYEVVASEKELIVKKALETVQAELDACEEIIAQTNEKIDATKECIKPLVLALGETYRGTTLMAVWGKGADHWDTSGLPGFALAHPELNALKTTGKPTVTFRKITKKG